MTEHAATDTAAAAPGAARAAGTAGAANTGGTASSGVTAETLDADLARVTFSADGLVPAIVQQFDTGDVLMLGYMDAEALRRTLQTGRSTFWSRSRQEYWRKGDTSGHAQYVKDVSIDCDGDTVLVRVDQVGAACHTGTHTCFDGRALTTVTADRPAIDEEASR